MYAGYGLELVMNLRLSLHDLLRALVQRGVGAAPCHLHGRLRHGDGAALAPRARDLLALPLRHAGGLRPGLVHDVAFPHLQPL